jgi:hypothetical protein
MAQGQGDIDMVTYIAQIGVERLGDGELGCSGRRAW